MNSTKITAGNAVFNQAPVSKFDGMVTAICQANQLELRLRRNGETQLLKKGQRERKGTGRVAPVVTIVHRAGQDTQ